MVFLCLIFFLPGFSLCLSLCSSVSRGRISGGWMALDSYRFDLLSLLVNQYIGYYHSLTSYPMLRNLMLFIHQKNIKA